MSGLQQGIHQYLCWSVVPLPAYKVQAQFHWSIRKLFNGNSIGDRLNRLFIISVICYIYQCYLLHLLPHQHFQNQEWSVLQVCLFTCPHIAQFAQWRWCWLVFVPENYGRSLFLVWHAMQSRENNEQPLRRIVKEDFWAFRCCTNTWSLFFRRSFLIGFKVCSLDGLSELKDA